MDWKSVRKPIFLFLSFGFFFAGTLNFLLIQKGTSITQAEQYAASVREKVSEVIASSDKELSAIRAKYHKTKVNTFSEYKLTTVYPYYIFRNGQLVYWSDHRFVPSYQAHAHYQEPFLLSDESGKYIVNTSNFNENGNKIVILSFITLYRQIIAEPDYSVYNLEIFPVEPEKLLDMPAKANHLNVKNSKNHFLFSVEPPQIAKSLIPAMSGNSLLLMIAGLVSLGIYTAIRVFDLIRMRYFGRALVLLAVYLIFVRVAVQNATIPFVIDGFNIFNSRILTINALAPSLGTVLLNAIIVFILACYVAIFFYKSNAYSTVFEMPTVIQHFFSVVVVATSVLNTLLFYRNISNIYEKSQFMLDLGLSVSFSPIKITILILYIIISGIFFLVNHLLCCFFLKLNKELKLAVVKWLVGVLIGLLIIAFVDKFRWEYIVSSAYFLLTYTSNLPRFFYGFKFKTVLYFISGAFVTACIAVFVIFEEEQKKDFVDKQNFAVKVLDVTRASDEESIAMAAQVIEQDTNIAVALNAAKPGQVWDIARNTFPDIERYNIDLLAFDKNGKPLDASANPHDLKFYEEKFRKDTYKTNYPQVFCINNQRDSISNQYVAFVSFNEKGSSAGNLILIKKSRFAFNVFRREELGRTFEIKEYSYAVFDQRNLPIFQTGSFNYNRLMAASIINNTELFKKGVIIDGYRHVGKKGQGGLKIIISSEYPIKQKIFSDFSFLFFLSLLFVVLIIAVYTLIFSFRSRRSSLTGRIGLYYNLAFIVPLILAVSVVLWVIKVTFISNQENKYLHRTQSIAVTIQNRLERFGKGGIDKNTLIGMLNELARDAELEIDFYSLDGRLNVRSQLAVYKPSGGLGFINPDAYRKIIEEQDMESLLNENKYNLDYKTGYRLIKGNDGKALGIIGIPFFDAQTELDKSLGETVGSILNVFTILFLILLIVAYYTGRLLTKPLRTLTYQLRKTDIDKLNERLIWNSEDEIGLLMKAYNKMLKRLEDSKNALALSQKQTAWREMAKQVVHEIKNPLTPMKLSIQQLQRTLTVDNPKAKERIERALNSLTDQIDNISEIANSFSEFAKMPVPRSEVFDLVPLLRKSAGLYAEDDKMALNAYIKEKSALVLGDRQFMSRVITNLIINGIQSVPAGRRPIINLRLYKSEEDKVIIEIQDNGSGIPENYRQKVFRPNFTTKVGGSGLGLAMARRGVEHAGGNIWFETENGRGTTFYIDLPLTKR